MWRLLHFLFGWDYIYWRGLADWGIARVHVAADGTVFYWQSRVCCVLGKIERADDVVWLTCLPEKYIGASERPEPKGAT